MSNEDIQIANLKNQFLASGKPDEQKSILDILIQHGDKGRTIITELLTTSGNEEVKSYGLKLLK